MLHTQSRSPADSDALELMLRTLTPGDGVLLMQDAVIAATLPHWQQVLAGRPCYALREDLEARGLISRVRVPIEVVDYDKFVQLTLEFEKVQAW
ncbi:sulfurtransferase complex subunit TusB [Ferrimonas sediminicola]|uniref:Sulfurtransferase complex subunit TusB n=1 Tax=Ferrimonas sediminicola TaxID=2569538 RepID=A0A4U1BCU5_9GAMM|nr:sulfurtransferase complex subunit TusB [Ferrimonas sediminicola]TKB48534.1 sulfurtransferase complex subunit TusB [Ferrimonas sediminicola]